MSITEVNKDNFEKEVLKNEGKVLVDFNADWCGPCKMLKPLLEEIAETHKQIKVISINIDKEGELTDKYNVSSIPCLVLFDSGEEIKRNVGLISKDEIEDMIGE